MPLPELSLCTCKGISQKQVKPLEEPVSRLPPEMKGKLKGTRRGCALALSDVEAPFHFESKNKTEAFGCRYSGQPTAAKNLQGLRQMTLRKV